MRILAIRGSLRAASINAAVLEAAALLAPAGLTIVQYSGLAELPIFNPDLDTDSPPDPVRRLRENVGLSEGLLIASPETSPGYIERLNDLCVAANFTPTATHPVEGAANLLCMVAAGYGVAILPEVVTTSSVHNIQTRQLCAPVPPFRLKLLWLRETVSPLLQDFLAVARQWGGEAAAGGASRRKMA